MAMDLSSDWGDIDDNSNSEYNITADDGYDADIEVPINQNFSSKFISQHNSLLTEVPNENCNANPALCSLTIDLLIHFSSQ